MSLNFIFCLHNHQPVGNFGHVLERVFEESYSPFITVLRRHPMIKVALHFSGVLYQWLEQHHPDFIDELGILSREGRIEFLSGGFYEPILAVIPPKDRSGQLERMKVYLESRFGQTPRGMWLTERVWEPSIPRYMAGAGLQYGVVDDFHLRAAGISEKEIVKPYLTADGDAVVHIIGGSEKLRYLIPYEDPEKTMAYLRNLYEEHPSRSLLVTMADDGEKLGAWPGTHKRVYQEGWLEHFFSLLEQSGDWLHSSTFREALLRVEPGETVYLPTVSYMEMSEWTLNPEESVKYTSAKEVLASHNNLGYATHLLRGGYWRNFLTKYPESRHLLGRMFYTSNNVHSAREKLSAENVTCLRLLDKAVDELWQAQCNDVYWHGVFGGLYLPFLRSAAYEHLIQAESTLEQIEWGENDFISLDSADIDGDGNRELIIKNRSITMTVDPHTGCILELDYKPKSINIFNTLNRREEAYHRRIRHLGAHEDQHDVQSIHHIEKLKTGHTPPSIVYDDYPRKGFTSHCWTGEYPFRDWCDGIRSENWHVHNSFHHAKHLVTDAGIVLELNSNGHDGIECHKMLSLARSEAVVSLGFRPCVPFSHDLFIGQEFNLTPTSLDQCLFEITDDQNRIIHTRCARETFNRVTKAAFLDNLKSFTILFEFPQPVTLWTCPLATLSNSESGYEEILQQLSILFWSNSSTIPSGTFNFSITIL